jgi:hypothetical protein
VRLSLTHPDIKNPVLRLRTPDEELHQQALEPQLRAALVEKKNAAAALRDAVAAWEHIDQAQPIEERKANYLLSLGLQPHGK